MAAVVPGAKNRTIGTKLAGSSPTDCLEVPAGASADVLWIAVADDTTGHPVDVLIAWRDSSAATSFALPKGATDADIECKPLRLNEADAIIVTGAAGQSVTISYIEYPNRPVA